MADAFLTGSHAYGEPRAGSDVDLVVLISEQTLEKLACLADLVLSVDGDYETENKTASLRFGDLNLLCCLTPEVQDVWRKGTRFLKDQRRRLGRPIERGEACEYFRILRKRAAGEKVPEMFWSKTAPVSTRHKKDSERKWPTEGLVDPPTDRIEDIPF